MIILQVLVFLFTVIMGIICAGTLAICLCKSLRETSYTNTQLWFTLIFLAYTVGSYIVMSVFNLQFIIGR